MDTASHQPVASAHLERKESEGYQDDPAVDTILCTWFVFKVLLKNSYGVFWLDPTKLSSL